MTALSVVLVILLCCGAFIGILGADEVYTEGLQRSSGFRVLRWIHISVALASAIALVYWMTL